MSKAKVTNVKSIKAPKTAHTSNTKKGMGDYYGSGMKNPVGKSRDNMMMPKATSKSLGKAPRSLG